jgi:heme A synthase
MRQLYQIRLRMQHGRAPFSRARQGDPLRGLIGAQALTGIATLVLGVPAILSIAHQMGGTALLAVSLVILLGARARSSPTLRLVASRAAA